MGLTVSKSPETTTRLSLEASSARCLAQCSRTELHEAELLVNAYDTAWYGESSSSALHTALDYSAPSTPRQQPGQAVYCSSPTTPMHDSPLPRSAAPRQSCSPGPLFDSMDDLTEWGKVLCCNADWLPNVKEPNGVFNALAAATPSPGQQYRKTGSWTFLPDIPLPILRSLSDPNPLLTTTPSSTINTALQSCSAAAQQYSSHTSSKHPRTQTSSIQHYQAAFQKMRSTANVLSSRLQNWWFKPAAGKVAAAAHHPLRSPLATALSA